MKYHITCHCHFEIISIKVVIFPTPEVNPVRSRVIIGGNTQWEPQRDLSSSRLRRTLLLRQDGSSYSHLVTKGLDVCPYSPPLRSTFNAAITGNLGAHLHSRHCCSSTIIIVTKSGRTHLLIIILGLRCLTFGDMSKMYLFRSKCILHIYDTQESPRVTVIGHRFRYKQPHHLTWPSPLQPLSHPAHT